MQLLSLKVIKDQNGYLTFGTPCIITSSLHLLHVNSLFHIKSDVIDTVSILYDQMAVPLHKKDIRLITV